MQTLNVDAAEVEKFEKLAASWWDAHGPSAPLHKMNSVRANYIDGRSPVAEKKVLDVGCGGGLLCEALTYRGANVTGIDMGTAPIQVATLHAKDSGLDITYKISTAESLVNTDSGNYDVVTCLEMLEHVPDPESTIQAIGQLVKPGGDVFFSTINRNPKAYALAVIGAEYIAKVLPKGTHHYDHFIKPSELSRWCRQSQLEVQDISGLIYNPFMKKFKIDQRDVDVNYLIHAKRV